jgi:ferredoxin-NADP reductase
MMLMSGPWPKITYEGFGNLTLHGKNQVIKKTHIAGIAGGTGITPIYSIMNAGLKN